MKKTALNLAILGLSLFFLCAFAQLKSLRAISTYTAKHGSCNVAGVIEKENEKFCSSDSLGQTIIGQTIPKFHQQLSVFSPF